MAQTQYTNKIHVTELRIIKIYLKLTKYFGIEANYIIL